MNRDCSCHDSRQTKITNMTPPFKLFFCKNTHTTTIRDTLSWLGIRFVQGTTESTRHQWNLKAGIGARQTLLRTPIADSERLPEETAGRGLTSTLQPRNFKGEGDTA